MLGLVIIARGVLKGAKSWIEDEWSMYRDGKQHMRKLMHVRRNLAVYLLLGLEFIVAADIIDTMLHIHTLLLL